MIRLSTILCFLLAVTVWAPSAEAATKKAAPARDTYAETRGEAVSDPLEPFNRAVFNFNMFVDQLLIRPVARGYQHLPGFVQDGTHNFLTNLMSPVSMLNELLQGDLTGFNITAWRFVTNTILGVGGLVDVADYAGRPAIAREDFGQTLGHYGVGEGPYLVLPIVGPSNARDAAGRIVDVFTDPLNLYAMADANREWILWTRAGLTVVDTRAQLMDTLDDAINNSVDPYSTFRSAYTQNRRYAVRDRIYHEGGAMDLYSQTENEN